jgi:hypothetical protein
MLLKIVVYGYLSNIYSSRKLEAAVQESIYLMWLSGMARPDHHTINRFRSELLLSEDGIKRRKQRPADVAPVFGNIKHNKNFKWFQLRGTSKVEIEIGLIALAHNLAKLAA